MKTYTTKEAAEILGLKTNTVCVYCEKGKIPARKHGRDWLITTDLSSFEKKDGRRKEEKVDNINLS